MILRRNFHFLSFNTNPRFPPFLLCVRCKSGVLFVWRCFRDDCLDFTFLFRINRGIKHDFPFVNIRKVPREVLKTEGEARGFQPSRGTLRMLMKDKIMFDRYYCINAAKYCENEENIGALYFITSSHFPTRVRFKNHA